METKKFWWEDRLRKIVHNIEQDETASYSDLVLYVAKVIEAEKENKKK